MQGDDGVTWKANDRIFRAFARFLRDVRRKALLLAVAHGPDVAASQKLVEELGIEDAVRWIPPVARHELVTLYNAADLILDQFGRGDFGAIAPEAWACGRPVVINLKRHPEFAVEPPPALLAETEQEIYETLVTRTTSREALRDVGVRSREWVMKHQHGDAVIPAYLACYERVLSGAASGGSGASAGSVASS